MFRHQASRAIARPAWRSMEMTRPFTRQSVRWESSKPSPEAQQPTPKPKSTATESMAVYRGLSRPFLKVFLGAMLTYQILYYSWERMRTDEIMQDKSAEINSLEGQIEQYKEEKKQAATGR